MKKLFIIPLLFLCACMASKKTPSAKLPGWIKGEFIDDYKISYTISDRLFFMLPRSKFHIISWNEKEQYILARNGEDNPGDMGLYTRIDFMKFAGMEPWEWGFCLTVFDAKDATAALAVPQADRNIPKKGCNGFPFSRMKRR